MHSQAVGENDRALRALRLGIDPQEFLGPRRLEPDRFADDDGRQDLVGPAFLARVIGRLLLRDCEKRRAKRGCAHRLPPKNPHSVLLRSAPIVAFRKAGATLSDKIPRLQRPENSWRDRFRTSASSSFWAGSPVPGRGRTPPISAPKGPKANVPAPATTRAPSVPPRGRGKTGATPRARPL